MLDYDEALQRLLLTITPVAECETVGLLSSLWRVLGQDILAKHDAPSFDHSAMDGFAISDPHGYLQQYQLVVGRVAAGEVLPITIQPGQAVRILTGAPLPAGTTAIVPQENCQVVDGQLHLKQASALGQFIRYQAEEIQAGQVLLKSGQLLSPAAVALLASQGWAQVPVRRRLSVAVLSSGNELVDPSHSLPLLPDGKIYDSNRYQLLAWLSTLGACVVDQGILPDNLALTQQKLALVAQDYNVILTSGGASVGEEDHLKQALTGIGHLDFWKLAIKPGKPLAWGSVGNSRVFMLPGNPVASFVTFHQLVLPALLKMAGHTKRYPITWQVRAGFSRTIVEERREFLRAVLQQEDDGVLLATPLSAQGPAMLSSCVEADGLLEIPPAYPVNEGDWLTFYPIFARGGIVE